MAITLLLLIATAFQAAAALSAMSGLASRPVVTFVTGNAKKLEEVRAILAKPPAGGTSVELPVDIISAKLDLPELQVR